MHATKAGLLLNFVTVVALMGASFSAGWWARGHRGVDTINRAENAQESPDQGVVIPLTDLHKTVAAEAATQEKAVSPLIQISDDVAAEAKRSALIRYIWRGREFPVGRLPDAVEVVEDARLAGLTNLQRISRLEIRMAYGVQSIVYLLEPIRSNNRLMIYYQGHGQSFISSGQMLGELLAKGYNVLALDLPLSGLNNQPMVTLPHLGSFPLLSHNQFVLIDDDDFSPVSFFMEPVAAGLNYFLAQKKVESIRMMGISGGGWATTLYAAIDPRVDHSYPVAGSLPFSDRVDENDVGDYEQLVPDLYVIANYLELYVLGSLGEGRRQMQVLNEHDSCCFAGDRYSGYAPVVQSVLDHLGGGSFVVAIDVGQAEHVISEDTLAMILSDD